MNNHWGTNYRAYQEGAVRFRFAVRPHAAYDAADATRFATGLTQPLLALPPTPRMPSKRPRLTLATDRVIATAFKASDDGKGWILRLYNVSDVPQQVGLSWDDPMPTHVFVSDTSERRRDEVTNVVAIPAWGVVTLRAER
jgi:alpha-mannosidase